MTTWSKCLLVGDANPHTAHRLFIEPSLKFITPAWTVRFLWSSHNHLHPESSTPLCGGGLLLYSCWGHQVPSHTGGTRSISAYQVFWPNDGLGMVMFPNLANKQVVRLALTQKIVDEVLSLRRIDWSARLP